MESRLTRVESVSIDVSEQTHRALSHLAEEMGMTMGDTLAVAVRRLMQHHMGQDLAARLDAEEIDWLEADLS